MSISAHNFPRIGKNTNVYLGSAELGAICSRQGRIPRRDEYMADMGVISADGNKIYQYMSFDRVESLRKGGETS